MAGTEWSGWARSSRGRAGEEVTLRNLPGDIAGIRAVAERVVRSYGLDLFDVQARREAGGLVVRILIDRPGPAAAASESVSIDDCARVSRDVGAIFDVEDVVAGAYTLEVSSPGLDRPLRHADDYRRFIGRLAKVVVSAPVDGQRFFEGRLRGVDADAVVIEGARGRLHRLPLDVIARGRLEVEF